jgi:hypothetical protein
MASSMRVPVVLQWRMGVFPCLGRSCHRASRSMMKPLRPALATIYRVLAEPTEDDHRCIRGPVADAGLGNLIFG